MRLILFSFFILSHSSSFSQNDSLNNKEIKILFEEINRTDATHINEPEIRQLIFNKNFTSILKIIEHQGFPCIENDRKLNKSIVQATRRTLIHILQSDPILLLNPQTIELFQIELLKNCLSKEILTDALQIFNYDNELNRSKPWTNEIKSNYALAIKSWGIVLENK